jgi:hypothetical protein
MPCKKDQYDEEYQAQHPKEKMHQDTANMDLTRNFLNHHSGALFYFQISKKSPRIQRNFDICSVFPDQLLFSFVKPKKELSREKYQVINF